MSVRSSSDGRPSWRPWTRCSSGRSAGAVTLVVGGEAGVGESRLIGELVTRRRAAGMRALVGGCVELDGGGIPLAPLVDMLRALAAELPGDELDALLGPARSEIGRLAPELADGREAQAPTDPDPSRILELLLGVIGRVVAERPLLLVVRTFNRPTGPRSTSSRCSWPLLRRGDS